MFRAIRRIGRSLARGLALFWVRYDVQVAGQPERYRRVCYVIERDQLLDRLIVEDLCRTRGWALPYDEIPNTLGLAANSLLALRRGKGILRRRLVPAGDRRLEALVEWLDGRHQADIDLVPINVFWGRAPVRERSWLKLLFSDDWQEAGRVRRLLTVLLHGRNVLVKVSEPVSLQGLLREDIGAERVRRKTARLLRVHFRRQRAATIGPDLSHRRLLAEEIVRDPRVKQAIAREVANGKRSERRVRLLARSYALEIAADYSYPVVRLLERALTKLWTRLYDGVEVSHLDTVRQVAPGSELVYVPCHRSHIDYLLLSYVIYRSGLALPHVAAGVNLNFPIVGPLLRRGGAFFIRRTFKGNALYTAVFRTYLASVLRRGYPLEYFVEGTRSRTGRLLSPKGGLLSMTVQNFLENPGRSIVFVPVFFGYEKLIEGETFLSELKGASKRQESLRGLFRSLRALRGEFGQVQVSFGEPIPLGQSLDRTDPGWRETQWSDHFRPDWFAAAVDDLGREIMESINEAAAANPTCLLALVLLATPKQAIVESDLMSQIALYQNLAKAAPYAQRVTVSEDTPAEMIGHGEKLGWLARRDHPLGDVLYMKPRRAVLASYYRNTILHLYALPGLIATTVAERAEIHAGELESDLLAVYPFLKRELFLRWDGPECKAEIARQTNALVGLGLLRYDPVGRFLRRPLEGSPAAAQLELAANVLVPFLERYYLSAVLLIAGGSGQLNRESTVKRCQQAAEHLSLVHALNSPDLSTPTLFRTFLNTLIELGLVEVDDSGHLAFDSALADLALVLARMIPSQVQQTLAVFARNAALTAEPQEPKSGQSSVEVKPEAEPGKEATKRAS